MRFLSCLRLELKRIFCSGITWIAMAITIAAPLAGYQFIKPVAVATETAKYLGNPTMTAAWAGTIIFALLTLFEMDRVHKNRMDAITDAAVSPVTLDIAHLLAVQAAGASAVVLAAVLYLPFTIWKLAHVFRISTYLGSFFLIMLPGILFGALLAAALYQIFRRTDISFVLIMALLIVSRGKWFGENYLMQWSAPWVPALSDDFSNAPIFRPALYSRLFWLAAFGALWILSLLCIRKYKKNLLSSLARGMKKVPLLLCAVLLAGSAFYLYQNEPFLDHSPEEIEFLDPEVPEGILYLGSEFDVKTNTFLGTLSGTGVYHLENMAGTEQEFIMALNPGYDIKKLVVNGEACRFEDLKNDNINSRDYKIWLPADEKLTLEVEYGGMPTIWNQSSYSMYGPLISGSYMDLITNSLYPNPMLIEKEDSDITVRFTIPEDMTPVTMGDTTKLVSENGDGTKTWLAHNGGRQMRLYAGDYMKVDLTDNSGTPIEFYYSRKHQKSLDQFQAIDIMKDAVDYCIEQFGPLRFSPDRPFKIVQSTAFLFGGNAVEGMSVMGEIYFTASNLKDKQKGAGAAEVLAHEIIHQWWGLSASLMDMEDTVWSDEGITTYTTYRLMRYLKGEDYAEENYVKEWKASVQNLANNFYARHPEYIAQLPDKYKAELDSASWGTETYDGMALVFWKAEQLIGTEKLDEILTRLFLEGGTQMPPYITYQDFLDACGLTKEDLEHV
ncbi:M1 family aminopeptidase [Anaerolentibacter hominis]|uniref:M1 family aminopeptidase n=1 Tax=Anaerolentibacter hominis TaxID=3079009 RepID=UPI0031B83777